MSAKLIPLASTRIRTSPAFGSGSGASLTCNTSGGPAFVIQICRMAERSHRAQGRTIAVSSGDHHTGMSRLPALLLLGPARADVRPRSDQVESDRGLDITLEHDLFRKPVSTFRYYCYGPHREDIATNEE